jgi:DNA polymerase-3 subunit beta
MKLSIAKSDLQRGLMRIQSVVERRNTMPILANVLLRAEKQRDTSTLELAATDLEVGIRSAHAADISKPGSLTVAAKKLFEIVRELPEEAVHLQGAADGYLDLQCARSRFHLSGTTADEYPALAEVSPAHTLRLPAVVLAQMIERTLYAASADETRYNLNGVFLEYQPEFEKLRMVATDGHRLAYCDRPISSDISGIGNGVIIPRKALAELKKLVDEDDADEIEIGFDGNNSLVRSGNVVLIMRLIEGEFPNYRQVIPRDPSRRVVLAAEPLSRAIRRVALLSAEHSRAIKIEFKPGQLTLTSSNPDLGEAREEIELDYAGEEVTIAFNARYLLDATASSGAKEFEFAFQDGLSPAQLIPTGDPDTLAVVMPMRL